LKSDALAFGHLGIIWEACYEAGDDNVGSSDDLEYLAKWQGEPGVLSALLVDSGFIDRDEAGIHWVHDLYDHAPDYVQRRMEREQERRAKGVTISELRAKAGRASGEARRKQSGTNDEHVLNTCPTNDEQTGTNGATPTPSPTPSPAHAPSPARCELGEVSPKPPPRARKPRRIPTTANDVLNGLVIPPELNTPDGIRAVREWLDHKDRIRNQYASKESFGIELSRWAKIGAERFAAAVRYSIGKEWKGIYEEQSNGNGRSNNSGGHRKSASDGWKIGPGQRYQGPDEPEIRGTEGADSGDSGITPEQAALPY
jgi:hypothetical protein